MYQSIVDTEESSGGEGVRYALVDGGASSDSVNSLTSVRTFSRRYLLVLLTVALLVVIDQAIIQPQLMRLNFYAPAINVAGRQRMLSQKLTKESLALATGLAGNDSPAHRRSLQQTIEQWSAGHRGLLKGNADLGLKPVRDPEIVASLLRLESRLMAICSAATAIATAETERDDSGLNAQEGSALDVILVEEPAFLAEMERVVELLERSAHRQVRFLRWCGVAAMLTVLGLLVGMYFVVLRPATGLIRQQIGRLSESESRHRRLAGLLGEARDELESRVAQRTSELLASNRALEHEIAERQAAEHRMRELSTELAHASRITALGQLATGLAHEINQPLASITNYADVLELSLERGSLTSDWERRAVEQMKQAALRAGSIVRRMRNFVRPVSGEGTLVEMNDLLREVYELCLPQTKQAQVRVTLALTDRSTTVKAEVLEIQQVLVNLVQNAVQALAESPRERREIRLRTRVDHNVVCVEVVDSGPGFATAHVDDAFAPFFTTKSEGLGLGLSICQSILERYQGRLWGENLSTGGALVGFCLPMAKVDELEFASQPDCICR